LLVSATAGSVVSHQILALCDIYFTQPMSTCSTDNLNHTHLIDVSLFLVLPSLLAAVSHASYALLDLLCFELNKDTSLLSAASSTVVILD